MIKVFCFFCLVHLESVFRQKLSAIKILSELELKKNTNCPLCMGNAKKPGSIILVCINFEEDQATGIFHPVYIYQPDPMNSFGVMLADIADECLLTHLL